MRFDAGEAAGAVAEWLRAEGLGNGGHANAALREVKLHLDTLKTVLVPQELFDRDKTGDYLGINNITIGERESVVLAGIPDGMVAIVVYPREVLDVMHGAFGDRLLFCSPFEVAVGMGGRHGATIYLTDNHAYITVRGASGWLRLCEVLPYSVDTDLLYYATRLCEQFDLARATVTVGGVGAQTVARSLRRVFRDCKSI